MNSSNSNLTDKRADSAELFWQDLVSRAFKTQQGFQELTTAEKVYFSVMALHGEVYNGGFFQYFFNSSGSYYEYAILGLEQLGASQLLAILKKAKSVCFGDEAVPENTRKRRESLLERNSVANFYKTLEDFDKIFCRDPDNVIEKITRYAKLHSLY